MMKHSAMTIIPLLLFGAVACGSDEPEEPETVTIAVGTSEFVGWEVGSTSDVEERTYEVTEGSEIDMVGRYDELTITIDEIHDDSIDISFSAPQAAGTSGGGSNRISGITVYEGASADFSSPTEDAVSIYSIRADFNE